MKPPQHTRKQSYFTGPGPMSRKASIMEAFVILGFWAVFNILLFVVVHFIIVKHL